MRLRGVEPPRPVRATRPSTLRVYQFRHSRLRVADDSRPRKSLGGGGGRKFVPERSLQPSAAGATLRTCVRPSHSSATHIADAQAPRERLTEEDQWTSPSSSPSASGRSSTSSAAILA